MKLSDSFFYTIREDVKDEDSISGNLLVRSGMIKKNSSGIYMFMPLGLKVLDNIRNIVRDEMNKSGASEVLMPSLVHEEYYEKSGRTIAFGSSVFKLNDRFNKPYVLGPTHEELFAVAGSMKIKSYKDLPFNLYQFQNKFRDEPRPRFGLIRVREFIMKDAYSFDRDYEGLDKSYKIMYDAYIRSFDRMGLKYCVVKADTGVMGGILSEEFQAITDIGEDILVLCDSCDFSSNIEVTPFIDNKVNNEAELEIEEVYTPDCKTIEDLAGLLNVDSSSLVKALMFNADGEIIMCFIRGDREVNLTKLSKLIGAVDIEMATEEEILKNSNACPGFTGPINLNAKIIIDEKVLSMKNFIVGANKKDYHLRNVNIKDFKYDFCGDIVNVMEGDTCPKCSGNLYFRKGIEIGNTFKLGTKYSECFNLKYLDEENKLNPVVMGSYGLGLGRCMASIVEQSNDEKGIIWPYEVAPYKVGIVVVNMKDESQVNYANKLYEELNSIGIDTLLDDRDERVGVKFNDMDLIGLPIRITVGKGLIEGNVELKFRDESESKNIKLEDVNLILMDYMMAATNNL